MAGLYGKYKNALGSKEGCPNKIDSSFGLFHCIKKTDSTIYVFSKYYIKPFLK